jgi:hypothetical protein
MVGPGLNDYCRVIWNCWEGTKTPVMSGDRVDRSSQCRPEMMRCHIVRYVRASPFWLYFPEIQSTPNWTLTRLFLVTF